MIKITWSISLCVWLACCAVLATGYADPAGQRKVRQTKSLEHVYDEKSLQNEKIFSSDVFAARHLEVLMDDESDELGPIDEEVVEEEEEASAPHSSHKPLFPLDWTDYLGIVCAIVGLIIAASGGIGGGGVLVPIYIMVMGFHTKYGIPLSNITILGSSITNVALNLRKRHPDADRPLVDWDLILVMEPLTIAGAVVGSFINKVLPDWFLVIMLVALLAVTAQRTLQKGFKKYEQESKALAKKRESELTRLAKAAEEQEDEEESTSLLEKSAENDEWKGLNPELKSLYLSERYTPKNKVLSLCGVLAVVLALNLLKGGGVLLNPRWEFNADRSDSGL